MTGWRRWFRDGREICEAEATAQPALGVVRLLQGDLGTEIRWNVGEPNVAALIAVSLTLKECQTPIVLRFDCGGWFEERCDTIKAAVARINDLITRGDRYFPDRVFVEEMPPDLERMPKTLKEVWSRERVIEDYAVSSFYDPKSESFIVSRVGPSSPIGKVWGTNPTTAPCRNSGAFAAATNHSYLRATRENRPIYEHVLATFSFPDNALRWVPYHRLILPAEAADHAAAVSVISECAEVEFRL